MSDKIVKHIEKALTFGELADFYDSKHGGRKARTLPMDDVFNWAKTQPEVEFEEERGLLFWVDEGPKIKKSKQWMAIDGKCFLTKEQAQAYNDNYHKINELDTEVEKLEALREQKLQIKEMYERGDKFLAALYEFSETLDDEDSDEHYGTERELFVRFMPQLAVYLADRENKDE